MTVKVVDQHGEPVFGLPVEFLRSGPNAQQGDENWIGATKKANSNGNAEFVVNDTNGGKSTTYQAKVGKTSKTFADWTPKRSIK